MITHFESSIQQKTPGNAINFSEFKTEMAPRLPSQNMIYAVKIHGTFPSVTVRAIPAQEKPYSVLTDVVKQQKIFTYTNISGTFVGFYMPAIFRDLNIMGYHFHFISDDHTRGSHILDFTIAPGTTVQYDPKPDFTLALPASGPFASTDFSADEDSGVEAIGE
jgi:acetolactate decarboxylase